MNTVLKTLSIAIISIAACASSAAQNADSTPKPLSDATAFQAFGGKAGLDALMDDFMVRLLANPSMGPFFKDSNHARVKEQLAIQFCQVLGGGCAYKGPDMKLTHQNMDITKAHFNTLVEVLQESMNAKGVPFRAQNQLLAQLAPMHREVITVRPGMASN